MKNFFIDLLKLLASIGLCVPIMIAGSLAIFVKIFEIITEGLRWLGYHIAMWSVDAAIQLMEDKEEEDIHTPAE